MPELEPGRDSERYAKQSERKEMGKKEAGAMTAASFSRFQFFRFFVFFFAFCCHPLPDCQASALSDSFIKKLIR